MHVATDLAERVSPALAGVVRRVLDDPDRATDANLGSARDAIDHGLIEHMMRADELDARDGDAVQQELDELIEVFGRDTLLVRLLRYRAPQALSAVIEVVLERHEDPETPVTLGEVRAAIDRGLLPELVGEGVLDPDDDDAVPAQLEELVRVHGEEALAEDLLGPEQETS